MSSIARKSSKHQHVRRFRGYRVQIGYPFPQELPAYNNKVIFAGDIPQVWEETIHNPDIVKARLYRSGRLYLTYERV